MPIPASVSYEDDKSRLKSLKRIRIEFAQLRVASIIDIHLENRYPEYNL